MACFVPPMPIVAGPAVVEAEEAAAALSRGHNEVPGVVPQNETLELVGFPSAARANLGMAAMLARSILQTQPQMHGSGHVNSSAEVGALITPTQAHQGGSQPSPPHLAFPVALGEQLLSLLPALADGMARLEAAVAVQSTQLEALSRQVAEVQRRLDVAAAGAPTVGPTDATADVEGHPVATSASVPE